MTFDDGKGIGLKGEIVEARANSYNIDDDFEHLVAHAMSCTLESGAECAMGSGVLRFDSLDQLFDDNELRRFLKGRIAWDGQASHSRKGAGI